MRGLLIAAVLAAVSSSSLSPARADAPKLVAIASPTADARKAVAIGPDGQVYEPDGKGNWILTQACGVADPLVAVTSASGLVLADAKGNAFVSQALSCLWCSAPSPPGRPPCAGP